MIKNEKKTKLINDPVHGVIKLTDIQLALVETPEFQRLNWIKQLGLSFLTYPGAQHTRLSHSLGTSFIAGLMARQLNLADSEVKMAEAAGLLHDIANLPFSHTLEPLFEQNFLDYLTEVITGKVVLPLPNAGKIPEILENFDLNPKEIGELISNKHKQNPCLQKIIFSELDADRLDYLLRDGYFTGVAYGNIRLDRLINSMRLGGKEILFEEKGVDAVESALIARNLMYASVYFHKTTRIAGGMLLHAAKQVLGYYPGYNAWTDAELIAVLKENKKSKELIERLLYRNLYKTAFSLSSRGKIDLAVFEKAKALGETNLKKQILDSTGLKDNDVIIDFPLKNWKEAALDSTGAIVILRKSGQTQPIRELSSLAETLLKKPAAENLMGVYCAKENGIKVEKAVEKVFE